MNYPSNYISKLGKGKEAVQSETSLCKKVDSKVHT